MQKYVAPLPAPLYGAQYGRPIGVTSTQVEFLNATVPTSAMQLPTPMSMSNGDNTSSSERQSNGAGSSQEPPDSDPDGDPEQ